MMAEQMHSLTSDASDLYMQRRVTDSIFPFKAMLNSNVGGTKLTLRTETALCNHVAIAVNPVNKQKKISYMQLNCLH